jgi:hypothetical protein
MRRVREHPFLYVNDEFFCNAGRFFRLMLGVLKLMLNDIYVTI